MLILSLKDLLYIFDIVHEFHARKIALQYIRNNQKQRTDELCPLALAPLCASDSAINLALAIQLFAVYSSAYSFIGASGWSSQAIAPSYVLALVLSILTLLSLFGNLFFEPTIYTT